MFRVCSWSMGINGTTLHQNNPKTSYIIEEDSYCLQTYYAHVPSTLKPKILYNGAYVQEMCLSQVPAHFLSIGLLLEF
jgi:hypothetical protein